MLALSGLSTPTLPQKSHRRATYDKLFGTPVTPSGTSSPPLLEQVSHVLKATNDCAALSAEEAQSTELQCQQLKADLDALSLRLEKETRTVDGLRKLRKTQEENPELTWKTQHEIDLCENRILSFNKEMSDKSHDLLVLTRKVERHYLAVLRQQVHWYRGLSQGTNLWPEELSMLASTAASTPATKEPIRAAELDGAPVAPDTPTEPKGSKSPVMGSDTDTQHRMLQTRLQQLAIQLYQTQEQLVQHESRSQRVRAERNLLQRHVKALHQCLDAVFLYSQEPYSVTAPDAGYRDTINRVLDDRDRSSYLTADSGIGSDNSKTLSPAGSDWGTPGLKRASRASAVVSPEPENVTDDLAQLHTTSRQFMLRLYDAMTKCRNDVADREAQVKSSAQYLKVLRTIVDFQEADVPSPSAVSPIPSTSQPGPPPTSMEEEIARDTHLFEWFSKYAQAPPTRRSRPTSRSSANQRQAPSASRHVVISSENNHPPPKPAPETPASPSIKSARYTHYQENGTQAKARHGSTFKELRRQLSTVLRPSMSSDLSEHRTSKPVEAKKPLGGGWLFRQRSILSMSSQQSNKGEGRKQRLEKRHTVESFDQHSPQVCALRDRKDPPLHLTSPATESASKLEVPPHQTQESTTSSVLPEDATAQPTASSMNETTKTLLTNRISQLENAVFERDTVIKELSAQVHDLTLNLDHMQNSHLKVVRPIKSLFYQLPVFLPETPFIPPRAVTEWVEAEQQRQRQIVANHLESSMGSESDMSPSGGRLSLSQTIRSYRSSMDRGPVISAPTPDASANVQSLTKAAHVDTRTLVLTTTTTWNPAVRPCLDRIAASIPGAVINTHHDPPSVVVEKVMDLTQVILPDQLPRAIFSFAEFVERIHKLVQENAMLRSRSYHLEQVRYELDQSLDQLYQDREHLVIQREQLLQERDQWLHEKVDLLERCASPASPVVHDEAAVSQPSSPVVDDRPMQSVDNDNECASAALQPMALLNEATAPTRSKDEPGPNVAHDDRDLPTSCASFSKQVFAFTAPEPPPKPMGALFMIEECPSECSDPSEPRDDDEDGEYTHSAPRVLSVPSPVQVRPVVLRLSSQLPRKSSVPDAHLGRRHADLGVDASDSTPGPAQPRKRAATISSFAPFTGETVVVGPQGEPRHRAIQLSRTVPLAELRASLSQGNSPRPRHQSMASTRSSTHISALETVDKRHSEPKALSASVDTADTLGSTTN
ncbi:hypothetical protein H4R34_004239 [Dimargaris verticillata]|uniref:Uncharacterized protein n=1 Tax=Dimargaris verticillata TaxID=2761393 RepID=A0A9W8E8B8_9FUNG|nr:hypothetical protein H4R34_004239 [Dimargaris verticillata]